MFNIQFAFIKKDSFAFFKTFQFMFLVLVGFGAINLLLLINCARQISPSGGPPDKTPPRILKAIPENKSTFVPLDREIEIEFNESMNRKSLEKALFITPDPGERMKVKWKGRRLRIQFADSLKNNRTYVITLGTDLKDAHGNALSQSFTLAFSTGAEVSDGKISGQVVTEEKARGILIWAYILENEEEINPVERAGDYITQAADDGKYELKHLSEGRYRLFAIWDQNNNRFFEVGEDGIGVTSRDALLTRDKMQDGNLNFRITVQDTVGPALVSVSAADRQHLNLRFDEELFEDTIASLSNYLIQTKNARTKDSLRIRMAYLNRRDPVEIALVTTPQQPKAEYEITVANIRDIAGNLVDVKFNRAEFIGSVVPDSVRPKIVATLPADSARAVALTAVVELHFNEAMQQNSVVNGFFMRDSAGAEVVGNFNWVNPAQVHFVPESPLKSLMPYLIEIQQQALRDLFGNAAGDSTFVFSFTTLNQDTLASISGQVTDEDSAATGAILLIAKQDVRDGAIYQVKLDTAGVYLFKDILPGSYVIEGFRDRDGDGKYGYGRAFPFHPAERFFVYSEIIQVRSRWPNDGNDILIPK